MKQHNVYVGIVSFKTPYDLVIPCSQYHVTFKGAHVLTGCIM